MILFHPLRIRSNGRTLHGNTILFIRQSRIDRHLIICFIPVFQSQIIILCLQIDKWQKELVLNDLPEDPGHLIAIHLHQRCRHPYLFHSFISYLPLFILYIQVNAKRHLQPHAAVQFLHILTNSVL